MLEDPAYCSSAITGLVALGSILKQAEQVTQSKQCSSGASASVFVAPCKSLNTPFPPQVAFGHSVFMRAAESLTNTEIGIWFRGHCCDRPAHVVLGSIVERLWNLGLESH